MKVRRKRETSAGEDYRFMQEKIKRRPVEWRRILGRAAVALGMGVIFGIAAGFTMEVLRPAFSGLAQKDDGEENLSLNVEQSGEEETAGTTAAKPSAPEPEVTEELQKLENGIYQAAEEAKPFLVDVMGIREELDWFEKITETEDQSTGVIISIDEKVLVLTSGNKIRSANYIRVRFCDGTIAQGREIGYDGPTKLSVIQIENLPEETLKAIKVASFKGEEDAQGDLVIAIGRPLGQYNSIAYGHIAGQMMKNYTDALYRQIFTDITVSSEGQGVLVNTQGQVLGFINQGLAAEGDKNLLTALGTLETRSVVEKLMNGESPGYFGIEGQAFSSERSGIAYRGAGVYVTRVKKDFPAMAAGIQSGDILTKVGGEQVADMAEFQRAILKYKIGDKVPVTLMRMGRGEYKEMNFEVELGGY